VPSLLSYSTLSAVFVCPVTKTDMLRNGEEGHVRAERDILKSASLVSSPGGAEWIVKLHYSFQDMANLFLVRPPVFYAAIFAFDLMPNRS